jgi:hypothetical protein
MLSLGIVLDGDRRRLNGGRHRVFDGANQVGARLEPHFVLTLLVGGDAVIGPAAGLVPAPAHEQQGGEHEETAHRLNAYPRSTHVTRASSRYHRPMADTAPLKERLQEIGAQLDWVREYL